MLILCLRQKLKVQMAECDAVGARWQLAPRHDSLVADIKPQSCSAHIKLVVSAHTSRVWAHKLTLNKVSGKVPRMRCMHKAMSVAWRKEGILSDHIWKYNVKACLENLATSERMFLFKYWPTPMCPLCHGAWGTIGHILSSCPVLSANAYTYRHNMVCEVLRETAVRNGWRVASYGTDIPPSLVKPHLLTNIHNTRPDMVLYNDFANHERKIVLLEVTVTFDTDRNIEAARRHKVAVYNSLIEAIKLSHQRVVSVAIAPAVIGARGIIHNKWHEDLRPLELANDEAAKAGRNASIAAIKGSHWIWTIWAKQTHGSQNSGSEYVAGNLMQCND